MGVRNKFLVGILIFLMGAPSSFSHASAGALTSHEIVLVKQTLHIFLDTFAQYENKLQEYSFQKFGSTALVKKISFSESFYVMPDGITIVVTMQSVYTDMKTGEITLRLVPKTVLQVKKTRHPSSPTVEITGAPFVAQNGLRINWEEFTRSDKQSSPQIFSLAYAIFVHLAQG